MTSHEKFPQWFVSARQIIFRFVQQQEVKEFIVTMRKRLSIPEGGFPADPVLLQKLPIELHALLFGVCNDFLKQYDNFPKHLNQAFEFYVLTGMPTGNLQKFNVDEQVYESEITGKKWIQIRVLEPMDRKDLAMLNKVIRKMLPQTRHEKFHPGMAEELDSFEAKKQKGKTLVEQAAENVNENQKNRPQEIWKEVGDKETAMVRAEFNKLKIRKHRLKKKLNFTGKK